MHEPTLEDAFVSYRERVAEIVDSGDWARFGDFFTEDATYRRLGHPDRVGREEIRTWITQAMTTFPGNQLVGFDVIWRTFNPTRSQVVYELRNVMRDPGDGSVHAASTISLLTYAGDGLWSHADDVHNPSAYALMYRGWARAALEHGRLDPVESAILLTLGA